MSTFSILSHSCSFLVSFVALSCFYLYPILYFVVSPWSLTSLCESQRISDRPAIWWLIYRKFFMDQWSDDNYNLPKLIYRCYHIRLYVLYLFLPSVTNESTQKKKKEAKQSGKGGLWLEHAAATLDFNRRRTPQSNNYIQAKTYKMQNKT